MVTESYIDTIWRNHEGRISLDGTKGKIHIQGIPRENQPNEIEVEHFFTDIYALCPHISESYFTPELWKELRKEMGPSNGDSVVIRSDGKSIEAVLMNQGREGESVVRRKSEYEIKAPGTFEPFKQLLYQKALKEGFSVSDSDEYDLVWHLEIN